MEPAGHSALVMALARAPLPLLPARAVPLFLLIVNQILTARVVLYLQLDPENTGFIPVENFTSLVEHHELQLDPSKLDMLFALVQCNEDGQVCYQELIELVSSHNTGHSYALPPIVNGLKHSGHCLANGESICPITSQ